MLATRYFLNVPDKKINMIFNYCLCLKTKPHKIVCPEALRLRDITVVNTDSPLPCGDSFEIDLIEHSDVLVCGGEAVTFTIVDYNDDALDNLSISNGILEGETKTIDYDEEDFYEVLIKGKCGKYSDYMLVRIRFKNPCADVTCPQGQTCNQCGNCE